MAADEADREYLEDLDAFVPRPAGWIKILDRKHEVPYFHDLPLSQALALLQVEEDARGQSLSVQMEASWTQLAMLIPSLPTEARDRMSNTLIQRVLARAWRLAQRPPEGEDAGSVSSGSSPATGASMEPPTPR